MKRCRFNTAQFITTAVKPAGYPTLRDASRHSLPEIAVAGRSNVGKSTLLNHLFRSKGLVKTSSTPGKTQHLNFFSVDDQLAFADLPGYGFAKTPAHIRKQWGPMIQTYLEKREQLNLILFLLDIRRQPNEDDLRFLEWCAHNKKATLLVLTKVDKVKANERAANTKKILQKLDFGNLHHVHYSSAKNIGRQQLIGLIHEALEDELEDGNVA